MRNAKPRKLPRQARSRASVEAILGGCARILEEGGWAALTTNAIAETAGVGIGTVYDFFPNREAIVLALAQERLGRLASEVRTGLAEAQEVDPHRALDGLLRRIARAVSADRALYRVLLREPKLLESRPETRRALDAFFELGHVAGRRNRRLALVDPPADTRIISRMLAHAVLEIAWHERGEVSRERMLASLIRQAQRMLLGASAPAR